MTSGARPRGGSTVIAEEHPRPLVRVGLIGADPAVSTAAQEELARTCPEGRWQVVGIDDQASSRGRAGQRAISVIGEARQVLLEQELDVVVVAIDRPLLVHGRRVHAHVDPVRQCAAYRRGDGDVSVEAAGVAGLVSALLGLDGDEDDLELLRAATSRDAGSAPRGRGRRVLRALLVPVLMWRVVLGRVVATRPWLMAVHLSRTLLGASAAAFFAIVTPDFWLLADRMSPTRLSVISVLALGAGVLVLVLGGRLREEGRQGRRTAVHNAAVWLSVAVGVVTMYVGLVLVNLALTWLVLPRKLVAQTVGHPVDWHTMIRIGALVGVVSMVGSVFGAGLEDDEDVQEAAIAGADAEEPDGA